MPDTQPTESALNRIEANLSRRIDDGVQRVTENINAEVRRIDQRFDLLELAVKKAEKAMGKRLDGLNELRGMATDAQATYMPRTESELQTGANAERITKLELSDTKREGQTKGISNTVAYLITAITVLLGIAAYLAKHS